MKSREHVDPDLHLLRTIIRGVEDPRVRNELEGARFNTYAAFEARDEEAARRWIRALSAGMLGIEEESRKLGQDAVRKLNEALGIDSASQLELLHQRLRAVLRVYAAQDCAAATALRAVDALVYEDSDQPTVLPLQNQSWEPRGSAEEGEALAADVSDS